MTLCIFRYPALTHNFLDTQIEMPVVPDPGSNIEIPVKMNDRHELRMFTVGPITWKLYSGGWMPTIQLFDPLKRGTQLRATVRTPAFTEPHTGAACEHPSLYCVTCGVVAPDPR